MGHFVFWGFLPIISQLLSDVGRSADFPVRRKLLSHDRAANWVQVGVRTMLRTGKSALRDLRPRSLTGYTGGVKQKRGIGVLKYWSDARTTDYGSCKNNFRF